MPPDQHWSSPDEDFDPEWDDDSGSEDKSTTTECVKCGCEIYDDASRCPLCGEYQVGDRSHSAWEGRPFWWKLGGLLGILAVLFGLLTFCF